jgi:hypothetical protein
MKGEAYWRGLPPCAPRWGFLASPLPEVQTLPTITAALLVPAFGFAFIEWAMVRVWTDNENK